MWPSAYKQFRAAESSAAGEHSATRTSIPRTKMKTKLSPYISPRFPFALKYRQILSLTVAALSLLGVKGNAASPLYPAVVIGDGPLAYYRFNDSTNRPAINANSGSLGAVGNATNLNTHAVNESPIVGSSQSSTYF